MLASSTGFGAAGLVTRASFEASLFFRGKTCDQFLQALRKFYDLARSAQLKIDLVIARGYVIDRLPEANQRLDDLARQNEGDPDAGNNRQCGDNAQHPLGAMQNVLSGAMVVLNTLPVPRLQSSCQVEEFSARSVEIQCKLPQFRVGGLERGGDLRIERIHLVAKTLEQLGEVAGFQHLD
jgi:hypothetical protein